MFNIIENHREFVKNNIMKSFGVDSDIEKAHKVGDQHPTKPWFWTEIAPGKFDWRGANYKKKNASGGSSAPQVSQQTAAPASKPLPTSAPQTKTAPTAAPQTSTPTSTQGGNSKEIAALEKKIANRESKYQENLKAKNDYQQKLMDAGGSTTSLGKIYLKYRNKYNVAAMKLGNELYNLKLQLQNLKSGAVNPNSSDFDSAINVAKNQLSPQEIDAIKSRAQKDVSLRYGSEDIKRKEEDMHYEKSRVMNQFKSSTPDQKIIEENAKRYVESETYLKEYKRVLQEKRKERTDFLNNTGHDFTEDELKEYLQKYNTAKDTAAVVRNTWHTAMGRIGSTSETIQIGSGKEKPFSAYDAPDWRPIGLLSYSERDWNGNYFKVEVPIQSWDEIHKNLSDTENATLYLYKHPKQ